MCTNIKMNIDIARNINAEIYSPLKIEAHALVFCETVLFLKTNSIYLQKSI